MLMTRMHRISFFLLSGTPVGDNYKTCLLSAPESRDGGRGFWAFGAFSFNLLYTTGEQTVYFFGCNPRSPDTFFAEHLFCAPIFGHKKTTSLVAYGS